MFLVIPILLLLLSGPVREAADGVVEPTEEARDLFNPQIQAAPSGPYGEHNQ